MYRSDVDSSSLVKEQYVRKRDGKTLVAFDRDKITNAIEKALISSGEAGEDHYKAAVLMCCRVVAEISTRHLPGEAYHIEEIQDVVENMLKEENRKP